jgi:hypothetical protein
MITIKEKPKLWWMRQLLVGGHRHGLDLLDTLKLEDGSGFRNFIRMTPTKFECVLKMIGGKISKEKTRFRQLSSPSIRLAATLRFLASGDSFTSLTYTFRISKQAISQFVPEVCEAIISALQKFTKVSEKNI